MAKDSVPAKLKKEGKNFEILVDCDLAMAFRKDETIDIKDVVLTETIFTDVKKGIKASENDMHKIFGTDNIFEICSVIVKEGHVSATAEYMRKEREIKKRKLVNLIVVNAIDSKTGRPHPPQRVENALDESHFKIDEGKSAESQVKDAIVAINTILPIRYGVQKMEIKIPAEHSGKVLGVLRKYCDVNSESWGSDGTYIAKVAVPLGMQEQFEFTLNSLTKGDISTKKLE
jgi:ribosome maturation protein SDO1